MGLSRWLVLTTCPACGKALHLLPLSAAGFTFCDGCAERWELSDEDAAQIVRVLLLNMGGAAAVALLAEARDVLAAGAALPQSKGCPAIDPSELSGPTCGLPEWNAEAEAAAPQAAPLIRYVFTRPVEGGEPERWTVEATSADEAGMMFERHFAALRELSEWSDAMIECSEGCGAAELYWAVDDKPYTCADCSREEAAAERSRGAR